MASYQIKTQRTQFHISSLYKKDYKHLAFVTEYSVSHSPDSPEMLNKQNDLLMEIKRLRIELPSLYNESNQCFKPHKKKTKTKRKKSNVRKLTTKNDKITACSSKRNDNEEREGKAI